MPTFKEHSKTNWTNTARPDSATYEEINTGCLQRIADATELMAQQYHRLINERDAYKRSNENLNAENATLRRSNSALRGLLKKSKLK